MDTAAVFTEPILDAWGIGHYLLDTDDDVGNIARTFRECRDTQCPVAVPIGREYEA